MEKGTRIIWDSGFGYEIGYYISDKGVSYDTCLIEQITGISTGEVSYPKHEVSIYTNEKIELLTDKYGYEKKFSEVF